MLKNLSLLVLFGTTSILGSAATPTSPKIDDHSSHLSSNPTIIAFDARSCVLSCYPGIDERADTYSRSWDVIDPWNRVQVNGYGFEATGGELLVAFSEPHYKPRIISTIAAAPASWAASRPQQPGLADRSSVST